MKAMKSIGTALASVTLACAVAIPAFAANPVSGTSPAKDASSSITGIIMPTKITVTMPTQVAFNLDPFLEAEDPSTQIYSPSNYTITNWTVGVPVYTAITDLSLSSDEMNATVAFTDSKDNVANVADAFNNWTNTIMFSIKTEAAQPTDFETGTDWLLVPAQGPTDPYVAGPRFDHPFFIDQLDPAPSETSGKMAAATIDNSDPDDPKVVAGGGLTMKFYAKAAAGESWVAGKKFLISPTFTVKVTDWKNDQLTAAALNGLG